MLFTYHLPCCLRYATSQRTTFVHPSKTASQSMLTTKLWENSNKDAKHFPHLANKDRFQLYVGRYVHTHMVEGKDVGKYTLNFLDLLKQ